MLDGSLIRHSGLSGHLLSQPAIVRLREFHFSSDATQFCIPLPRDSWGKKAHGGWIEHGVLTGWTLRFDVVRQLSASTSITLMTEKAYSPDGREAGYDAFPGAAAPRPR